jgi:hypothetical protein
MEPHQEKDEKLAIELARLKAEQAREKGTRSLKNEVQEAWERLQKFIFKTDEKGEYILNSNGKRVVAWARVILKLISLIALFIQYMEAKNNEKPAEPEKPAETVVTEPVEPADNPPVTESETPNKNRTGTDKK